MHTLLSYTVNKSIDEAEVITKTLKKQMILERRNMFDPGRYFGCPKINSLEADYDKRIDQMFQKPCRYKSEINLHSMLGYKPPAMGVADALKKSLNKSQKLCLGVA